MTATILKQETVRDTLYLTKYAFKNPQQLPFFMIWTEHVHDDEVYYATADYVKEGLEP